MKRFNLKEAKSMEDIYRERVDLQEEENKNAFEEGNIAFKNRESIDSNPYTEENFPLTSYYGRRAAWHNGWLSARYKSGFLGIE